MANIRVPDPRRVAAAIALKRAAEAGESLPSANARAGRVGYRFTRGTTRDDMVKRMQGAQATVLMQGSADLLRETQDVRVLVVPNFDAAGAALATMAISPAIGLGTLFATWALREPLIAAGTSELHITGSWADPQVQRIAGPTQPQTPAGSDERRPPG